MPFSHPHYLLQFGGDLAVDEIWSCGIRISITQDPATGLSKADELAAATGAKNLLTTWLGTGGSGWSSRTKLRYVKLNLIGLDGHYADTANTTAVYLDGANIVTGGTASTLPNSTALVLSWLTAAQRGRASQGRIFMPSPAFPVTATSGRFSTADTTTAATHAKTFLNGLKTQPQLLSLAAVPMVASKLGAGLERQITAVRVGDVPDTMRSRRESQKEVYSQTGL